MRTHMSHGRTHSWHSARSASPQASQPAVCSRHARHNASGQQIVVESAGQRLLINGPQRVGIAVIV